MYHFRVEDTVESRAMDDKECWFSKEGSCVLSDPAAIARRKRMEIRRFKKLSYFADCVRRDAHAAQISLHLKRARPPAHELCDSWEDTKDFSTPFPKLKKEEGDICVQTSGKEVLKSDHSSLKLPRAEIALSSAQSKACISWSLLNQGCPLSGKLLLCGQRREMKDRVAIVPSFVQLSCHLAGSCSIKEKAKGKSTCGLHFFAVYDGHGGSQASQFCMERLHLALAEELATLGVAKEELLPCDWKGLMAVCFSRIDKELVDVCRNGHGDDKSGSTTSNNVGTTAVVVVVSSCQIVVASCGNSRAVLSRGGKAIPLSFKLKPEREDETNRVEAAGGHVIFWDGDKVGGLFASPRAMGDQHFVLSKPEVTCIQRSEEDECLILGSNGLWDVSNDDTTCEIARKRLASARNLRESAMHDFADDPASSAAAALLVKVALGQGSKDNISVVVVDLKS